MVTKVSSQNIGITSKYLRTSHNQSISVFIASIRCQTVSSHHPVNEFKNKLFEDVNLYHANIPTDFITYPGP